ncbi:hypothetical protein [Desertibaculum subflavum]|uniref:hypothetical protein n=1 Tax=Desertibaculum subflavum TaxID=2268458 RepID=UPI000E672F68
MRAWLDDHDLGQCADAFASNHIDAKFLPTLTGDDLNGQSEHKRDLFEEQSCRLCCGEEGGR